MENNKNVWVIFGFITFDTEFAEIHKIDNIMQLPKEKAWILAEELLGVYDSYIIPEVYSEKPIKFNLK